MSIPVASEQRKSFLPLRLRSSGIVGPRPTLPMPAVTETNNKSSLTVGDRVLVNGLKSGVLRYIGQVQFAQGLFCGVELDEPEGKHDGEVKDIRYFQCAANHGIFVPKDKVTLAPRIRTSSSQRPVTRLKIPTLTRSITLTSSINKIEPSKPVQLPDIVPNSTTQPVTVNESIENEKHETILSTERPKEKSKTPVESLPILIDEPSESIDADFTDSVSLILHQLQQEEQQQPATRLSSSIVISEEESDYEDDIDTESVAESIAGQTHRSSTSSVFVPINLSKSIQTDLSFNSKDNISFTKKSTPIQPVKKPIEKRPIVPVTNVTKRPITKKPIAITPAKKTSIPKAQFNSVQSVTSLPSQSRLSLSRSSCNSLNSSQSDVASLPKPISDKTPSLTSSETKPDESHQRLLSLQTTHQRLQTSYQYLLRKFDLMTILNQYFLTENQQIQQEYQQHLSKIRIKTDQLKNSIEQLQISHKNELIFLTQQSQNEIEKLNNIHEQHLNEYQQKIDELLKEKQDLDIRCGILQEKVDGFLGEMANSEHADVLLCHVETLEKDRTSLQTVLELKNKEITQLRTKMNEQEMKLTDEKALQKRIEMADNRIQDLEWLLRDKQLSEKAAVIERDELKERVGQFERDNSQLKFENETLRYRLQDYSLSISTPTDTPIALISNPIRKQVRSRKRANSLSSTRILIFDNQRKTRSLICIFHR